MRSELLTRQWRHVDFNGKGWLRIDAGEAKDATAGREFQFTTWMRDALERQRKFVSRVEKRTKAVIPWVFCRPDGGFIGSTNRGKLPARLRGSSASRTTSAGQRSGISNAPVSRARRRWR